MSNLTNSCILENVPAIENLEYPDIFIDALCQALCYRNDALKQRFPEGIYPAVSGFTGRGWLVGFDDAGYYWEKSGQYNPQPSFALSSLDAHLAHVQSLVDAVRFLGYVPEFLWNHDCTYPLDPQQAAGFMAASQPVDCRETRRYVMDSLSLRQRPVVVLLHLPSVPIVEMALLSGYTDGGDTVLGRSPYAKVGQLETTGCGYFRLMHWADHVLAVLGVGNVETQYLASGNVKTQYLASGNVETQYLASGNVNTQYLASGNVETQHLGSGNVETQYLASGNVNTQYLASGNVNTQYLASGNVETQNLASGNVNTQYLASGNVETQYLASDRTETQYLASLTRGEFNTHPGYIAIQNAMKYSRSYRQGTQHFGLEAYAAWERALLDEESIAGLPDEIVAPRLLYHSAVAGTIASQRAFIHLPLCFDAPSMGVVSGLVRRGAAVNELVHGLMWDVWHVVGGYWRGIRPGSGKHWDEWANADELQRFRQRSVRERAVQVIRRAAVEDARSLEDLRQALEEWQKCLGRGGRYACPCWNNDCARV